MAQAHASSGDPDRHSPGSADELPATPSAAARVRTTSSAWHDVACILLNLVQVLVSILEKSFVVRIFYKVRLHMAQLIKVLSLLITAILMPLANVLTVRALSWTGCQQILHSTTSCDPSR